MKSISTIILVFLVLLPLTLQATTCKAETPIIIQKVMPIDNFGNINYYLSRGFQCSVKVQITSVIPSECILAASLFDVNNVPAGFASNTVQISQGENTLVLNFPISSYAYIGLGNLHLSISNLDHSPVASQDQTVAIQILGDFNKDGKMGASDLGFFLTGYDLYWQQTSILPKYQQCDFNKDNRLDSRDIAVLVCSCNMYWTNLPYQAT